MWVRCTRLQQDILGRRTWTRLMLRVQDRVPSAGAGPGPEGGWNRP
jgi:hypothetical protein